MKSKIIAISIYAIIVCLLWVTFEFYTKHSILDQEILKESEIESSVLLSEINPEATMEEDLNIVNNQLLSEVKKVDVIIEQWSSVMGEVNEEKFEKEIDGQLCMENEELIFSFTVLDSDKIVTIAKSDQQDYMVCKIGTPDQIELEFPQDKSNSWKQFWLEHYMRGGGYGNMALYYDVLYFHTEDNQYRIYWSSHALEDESYVEELELTITKKQMNGGLDESSEIVMKGDVNSIKGSFLPLIHTKINMEY